MGTRYNRLIETCTHSICFEPKYEKVQNNSTENCHFNSLKNRCILHGRVFVMKCFTTLQGVGYEPADDNLVSITLRKTRAQKKSSATFAQCNDRRCSSRHM